MKVLDITRSVRENVSFKDDDTRYVRYHGAIWYKLIDDKEAPLETPWDKYENAYREFFKNKPIHEIEPIEVNGIWYIAVGYDKPTPVEDTE